MRLEALIEEASRELTICNACRYCEGYCAVFPALERRTEVEPADVLYLANLCHDCRACYYACPYTEPHEFEVNVPRALGEVRRAAYAAQSPVAALRRAASSRAHVGLGLGALAVLVALAILTAPDRAAGLAAAHIGPGAFYEVVPWLVMVVPGLALGAYVLVALGAGAVRFIRATGGAPRDYLDADALLAAGWEALTLRWLKGGAEGCHYPAYPVSSARRVLHTLVAGGFVAAFASTLAAAFEQDVLGVLPPYPLLSVPVLLGSAGGIAMIAGCGGLLALKVRSDRRLTTDDQVEFDVAFVVVVGLSALTGMLVLALRDSAAMPALLLVHLAVLAALYVTAPYGKFAHFLYRYAALVRNRIEAAGQSDAAPR